MLEARSLSKIYRTPRGEIVALADLDLTLAAGVPWQSAADRVRANRRCWPSSVACAARQAVACASPAPTY